MEPMGYVHAHFYLLRCGSATDKAASYPVKSAGEYELTVPPLAPLSRPVDLQGFKCQ